MLMFKPFAKYADFKGRARRLEYWLFQLFQIMVYLTLIVIMFAGFAQGLENNNPAAALSSLGVFGFFCLFALACFLPNLAVTVRRLHDTNRSAWWLLLYIPGSMGGLTNFQSISALGSGDTDAAMAAAMHVSIVSLIAFVANLTMFVFMVWGGTRGPNRFGDDPKGSSTDIAHVFDAPEAERPAPTQPHKPIFDFSPAQPAPAARAFTPPPQRSAQAQSTGARPTFGKRR